jgi:hypothetical protein
MNQVYTSGGRKKEREIVEKIVAWSINELMPRMRTLCIDVELKKIDVFGYCLEEDNNRTFTLTVKKGLPIFDLVCTVIHEMIHVKQYARNELSQKNGRVMWKKEDHTGTNYVDTPWEKEAYAKEKELAIKCFKEVDIFV